MPDIAILGGGVAGLAAAHAAAELGLDGKVYEGSARWGGLLDRFTVNGFRFDHAVHLSFAKDPFVRSVFDQTPYYTHYPVPYNYDQGRWLKHPVQNNLYPLSVDEKIQAVTSFLERPEYGEPANHMEWLNMQYGSNITDAFHAKYTRKYWTVSPERLSCDWIGNRLYRPTVEEVLRGAFTGDTPNTYYAPEMRYPKVGGYKSFLTPLYAGNRIELNKKAIRIRPSMKKVEFADGSAVHYEALVSSIPLPELASMVEGLETQAAVHAPSLWATSAALVSVGFRRPDVGNRLWFYIYDEDILPSRAYAPHLKSPDNVPAGHSSYQFEIYYSRYKPLPMSAENLAEHVVDIIGRIGIAEKGDVLFTDVRNIPYANVVFDLGMRGRRDYILKELERLHIYTIGRFGEWDYLWSDQSLLSGRRAVERIWRERQGNKGGS